MQISIGIIKNKNNHYLIVERIKPEGLLKWQFPAGKVNTNEEPKETVIREVKEETGIICEKLDYLGTRVHPISNIRAHYFLITKYNGLAKIEDTEEIKSIRWVDSTELYQLIESDIFEPVKRIINRGRYKKSRKIKELVNKKGKMRRLVRT